MDSCPLPRVAPYSTRLTGYACTMTQMIKQWRTAWSTSPGTTDPEFPFGIVTLASTEVHDARSCEFRSNLRC